MNFHLKKYNFEISPISNIPFDDVSFRSSTMESKKIRFPPVWPAGSVMSQGGESEAAAPPSRGRPSGGQHQVRLPSGVLVCFSLQMFSWLKVKHNHLRKFKNPAGRFFPHLHVRPIRHCVLMSTWDILHGDDKNRIFSSNKVKTVL